MTLKDTIVSANKALEKYTNPGSSEHVTLAKKLMPALDGLSAQELTAVGRAIQSYVKGMDMKETYFREMYQYNLGDPAEYQLAACIAKEASNMQLEAIANAKRMKLQNSK